RANFLKVVLVGNLPNQPSAAIVGGDDEGIPHVTRLSLEICNLSESETLNNHIAENLKAVVDGSPKRSGDKGRFGFRSALCARVDCQRATLGRLQFLSVVRHRPHPNTTTVSRTACAAWTLQQPRWVLRHAGVTILALR